MVTSIESLPFEILCNILDEVARQNLQLHSTYTYGLSQAPEPGRDVRMQRVIRGRTSPDALNRQVIEGVHQVNRRWHDWASLYAFRSLYISRWRGSERYIFSLYIISVVYSGLVVSNRRSTDRHSCRWLQSRTLDSLTLNPSSIAVYRDPYLSLRKTSDLLNRYPTLAFCVRRLWFNGYYSLETNALIFSILRYCINVDHLTVPWTTLRYGSSDDWERLLGRRSDERRPLSLEFLAVDLGATKIGDARNHVDKQPLQSAMVDFGRVERLKIFGNTNFKPITDDDLFAIAGTAENLQEIHVTGTSSVSLDGVMALVDASKHKLQMLEHSPLAKDGFEHPRALSMQKHGHICELLLECAQLRNLSISLPSLCEHLFTDASIKWTGEVQIRAESLCNHPSDKHEVRKRFWHILDLTRSLMASRNHDDKVELDIQLFINYWIFEPRRSLVHGNIALGQALSDNTWPYASAVSSMGPYGQTGLYGKDEGPYSCISEEDFGEGLTRGYVSF